MKKIIFGVLLVMAPVFADVVTEDVDGHDGKIRVAVTVENKVIKKIDATALEGNLRLPKVIKNLIPKIVEKNSTDVDNVAGATIASVAIKNVVDRALSK